MFSPFLVICAVGSIQIQSINGSNVNEADFVKAFHLTPLVGISLRAGRDPTPHNTEEEEVDYSYSFLSSEPPLSVLNSGGSMKIRIPRDVSAARWYIYDNEWIQLDCPSRFLPVSPDITDRVVKCEYEVKGSWFTSYTRDPIGYDHSLISPIIPVTSLVGSINEGSIIGYSQTSSVLCSAIWSSNGSILSDEQFCSIPFGLAGKELRMDLYPVSTSFPNTKFKGVHVEAIIEKSDIEISKFSIPETIREGEEFEIEFESIPECQIKMNIETSIDMLSPFELYTSLTQSLKFSPPKAIVGRYLRVSCLIDGIIYYCYSTHPILPPKVYLSIAGSMQVEHPHLALFHTLDINESLYSLEWIIYDGSYLINTGHKNPVFIPKSIYVGKYLGINVYSKETSSIVFSTKSNSVLNSGGQLIDLPGICKPIEGSQIQMVQTGHWLISDIESVNGFSEVFNGESFTPTKNIVGRYLRFLSDQIDVIFGRVELNSSQIHSVNLIYTTECVGSLVTCDITMNGTNNVPIEIIWIRCSRGSSDVIVQNGGGDYIIGFDDVGSKIKARVSIGDDTKDSNLTSIIRSGAFKNKIISGPVIAGQRISIQSAGYSIKWFIENFVEDERWKVVSNNMHLDLLYCDIGKRIRIIVDTKRGDYYEQTQQVSEPIAFIGQTISVNNLFRISDQQLHDFVFKWYRFSKNEWRSFFSGISYNISQEDQKNKIKITMSKNRPDSPRNRDPYVIISQIKPRDKINVLIDVTPKGVLVVTTNLPSDEIASYFWRVWKDNICSDIENYNLHKLTPHPAMIGCEIEAGIIKQRSEEIFSSNKIPIHSCLPVPEGLMKEDGPITVGCKLLCYVKKNPKLMIDYKWKRWDGTQFVKTNAPRTATYIITADDIDCYICCNARFIDNKNKVGPSITVRSSGVIPPLSFISINGEPILGSTLSLTTNDTFIEKCKVVWQKYNENDWIEFAKGKTLIISANEVGYILRAIGADGAQQRISQEIGPVEGDSSGDYSVFYYEKGFYSFKAKDQSSNQLTIEASHLSIIIKSKISKKAYPWKTIDFQPAPNSTRRIDFYSHEQQILQIVPISVPQASGAQISNLRDAILSVLSLFKQNATRKK